jgi:hypothetical protein
MESKCPYLPGGVVSEIFKNLASRGGNDLVSLSSRVRAIANASAASKEMRELALEVGFSELVRLEVPREDAERHASTEVPDMGNLAFATDDELRDLHATLCPHATPTRAPGDANTKEGRREVVEGLLEMGKSANWAHVPLIREVVRRRKITLSVTDAKRRYRVTREQVRSGTGTGTQVPLEDVLDAALREHGTEDVIDRINAKIDTTTAKRRETVRLRNEVKAERIQEVVSMCGMSSHEDPEFVLVLSKSHEAMRSVYSYMEWNGRTGDDEDGDGERLREDAVKTVLEEIASVNEHRSEFHRVLSARVRRARGWREDVWIPEMPRSPAEISSAFRATFVHFLFAPRDENYVFLHDVSKNDLASKANVMERSVIFYLRWLDVVEGFVDRDAFRGEPFLANVYYVQLVNRYLKGYLTRTDNVVIYFRRFSAVHSVLSESIRSHDATMGPMSRERVARIYNSIRFHSGTRFEDFDPVAFATNLLEESTGEEAIDPDF